MAQIADGMWSYQSTEVALGGKSDIAGSNGLGSGNLMLSKSVGSSMLGMDMVDEDQNLGDDLFFNFNSYDINWESQRTQSDGLTRNNIKLPMGNLSLSEVMGPRGEERANDNGFRSNGKLASYGQAPHGSGWNESVSEVVNTLPEHDEIFEMDESGRPAQSLEPEKLLKQPGMSTVGTPMQHNSRMSYQNAIMKPSPARIGSSESFHTDMDQLGSSPPFQSIASQSLPNSMSSVSLSSAEHPLGEHPSRTLFIRNISSNIDDTELMELFGQHGDIRHLHTSTKSRGFIMVSFYDIRAAKLAKASLNGKVIRRRRLDIHYSIPKEYPSEREMNQGTLVVFNLDSSVSTEELRSLFFKFGEVKEVRETPNKPHHRFVEFYDVRGAEEALRNLNRTELHGKRIKIEASRPGGRKYSSGSNGSQVMPPNLRANHFNSPSSLSQEHFNHAENSFVPNQFGRNNGHWKEGPNNDKLHNTSSLHEFVSNVQGTQNLESSKENSEQELIDVFQSTAAKIPIGNSPATRHPTALGSLSPHSIWGSQGGFATYQQHSSMNRQAYGASYGYSPVYNFSTGESTLRDHTSLFQPNALQPRTFFPSEPSSLPSESKFGLRSVVNPTKTWSARVSGSSNNPSAGFNGTRNGGGMIPSGTPGKQQGDGPREQQSRKFDSSYQKDQFDLVKERVLSGMDRRTTLMLKNIPNKYTQKTLLEAIDEQMGGKYDFFYLPIDFKNRCNIGYAFINMISLNAVAEFYDAFNGRKWTRFNSEKVASVAYGRIQGKQALVGHFRNSNVLFEDAQCRPVLFNSEAPERRGAIDAFPPQAPQKKPTRM